MDPKAVNYNVTIDDFDSILTYSDQASWTSPDPSSFNYTSDGSPWLRGTYHNTTLTGASVALNFTGPAIYVYGAIGPAYGAYQVVLDNQVTQGLNGTAFRNVSSTGSHLLFGTSELTYGNHEIVLRNLGSAANSGNALLLDYIQTTIQLAPAGATVRNVTYEETNPAIRYNGTWGNNTSPVFSGGGSTYTNGDGAFFELTFQGSAIYVLGDKKNDHRGYTVTLDAKTYHYNGTSGCGGAFGLTCEEQRPCIKFMASNLAEGDHTLRLTNNANGPAQTSASFFDLDSIVAIVPSIYGPREPSNTTSPFISAPNSTNITGGTTGSKGSNSNHSAAPNSLLLLVFTAVLLLRPLAGRRILNFF